MGGGPTTLRVYLSPFGRCTWEAACIDPSDVDDEKRQKTLSPTITEIGKRCLKIRQKSISAPIDLKFGSFVEAKDTPNAAKFHAAVSPPSGDIKH